MSMRWWATVALTLVITGTHAATCDSLTELGLANAKITRAEDVPAGKLAIAGSGTARAQSFDVPAFCRVYATLTPSSDSDIKVEVWLPGANWNGKLMSVGNGGWSGAIYYGAMIEPLRRGYAVAGTDTGHSGGSLDGSFAYRHPEKLIDFGWRAVHEMTVKAKSTVSTFYGKPARYAYWNGCSSGGKQGLKEAQKFPDDYDGIIAGAPAIPWTRLSAASLAVGRATLPQDSAGYIPPASYRLIHTAVLDACDIRDGVADGVLEDPRECSFDPRSLVCGEGRSGACLTPAQTEALGRIYSPLRNPRTN